MTASLADKAREALDELERLATIQAGTACWKAIEKHMPLLRATLSSDERVSFSLRHLQQHLPWTIPYTAEFEASAGANRQRRIGHDVLHVLKSLGRIAADVEAADHGRPGKLQGDTLAKEVADLVICALHIARLEGFDLQDAVIQNSEARNAATIPPEIVTRPEETRAHCTNEEALIATADVLREQVTFLLEALEQYAMINTPMGEIARTALASYNLPPESQRRAISQRAAEVHRTRSANAFTKEDAAKLVERKAKALTEEYCHGDAGPGGYTWTNKEAEWQVILLEELAEEFRK